MFKTLSSKHKDTCMLALTANQAEGDKYYKRASLESNGAIILVCNKTSYLCFTLVNDSTILFLLLFPVH